MPVASVAIAESQSAIGSLKRLSGLLLILLAPWRHTSPLHSPSVTLSLSPLSNASLLSKPFLPKSKSPCSSHSKIQEATQSPQILLSSSPLQCSSPHPPFSSSLPLTTAISTITLTATTPTTNPPLLRHPVHLPVLTPQQHKHLPPPTQRPGPNLEHHPRRLPRVQMPLHSRGLRQRDRDGRSVGEREGGV